MNNYNTKFNRKKRVTKIALNTQYTIQQHLVIYIDGVDFVIRFFFFKITDDGDQTRISEAENKTKNHTRKYYREMGFVFSNLK